MTSAASTGFMELEDISDLTATALHQRLTSLNQYRFAPRTPAVPSTAATRHSMLAHEFSWRALELAYLETERQAVAAVASCAPTADPNAFLAWFQKLESSGEGQHDVLFSWLEQKANLDEMRWFLCQEMAGEAGFDDLVALTQLGFDERTKLELARNYWDELGRGRLSAMHGPMLHRLSDALELKHAAEDIVWQSAAVGNTMGGLAANRQYAYHSLGALGAVELTAPARCAQVNEGLKRLGVAPQARQYYALHATMDIKHSQEWNAEVLLPLVSANPVLARPLAEGALMRLRAGARAFARYREHFALRATVRTSKTSQVSCRAAHG